jgi:hypothetical protein
MYVKYTGTLDSACTITIAPNTVSKLWFIENGTSGSQNIIISQGTGANVTIPAGDTKVVYSDGAGSGAAVVDAFASLSTVDLKVQDDLTVTDDVIVNGDIDLEGSIDVNGTSNLDVVDIDGALTQDGGAVFNEDSADVDFRVESNGQTHTLFVDGALDNIGIGYSAAHTATNKGLVILTGDGNGGIQFNKEDGSYPSSGETLGSIGWKGADSANNNAAAGASIVGIAAEDFSGSTEATNLAFNTKPSGTGPGSAPSERMRILSDGNVGIGQSSPTGKLEITATGTNAAPHIKLSESGDAREFNIFNDGSGNGRLVLADSTDDTPDTEIVLADNGFIQFKTANTERMQVNDAGALLINTTQEFNSLNGRGNLVVGSGSGNEGITIYSGNDSQGGIIFADGTSGTTAYPGQIHYTHSDNSMRFAVTDGTEVLRIDSDGNLLLGTTTRINNSNTIAKTTDHVPLNIRRDNGASDNSILICIQGTNTAKMAVRGDGDLENVNNSYGALSDERLKSNIVDANSQLEDIKKVKVRNYTLDSTGETHIGVIAQELEAEGMNGLVVEREEGYKGVKYSILFMKAIKAIQEQQTQIEALQSEINTLKGG